MAPKGIEKLSLGILSLLGYFLLSFSQVKVDSVVASVNGEPILESDLKLGMVFYNTTDEKVVTQRLIDVWVLSQYVESRGGYIQDEYLDGIIKDIAEANKKSLEEFITDLYKDGISIQDLKGILRKILLSTQALEMLLAKDINVSQVELEIEKLKKGKVSVIREIRLITVDKKDAQRLAGLLEKERDIDAIGKALGLDVESLKVSKGELVDALDKEVWKAKEGEMVFAEDDQHIYVAFVIKQRDIVEDVDIEALKEEIIQKKLEAMKSELLEKLKKRSFIKLIEG